MTVCLPVIRRNDQILGSSFLVRRSNSKHFFVCTMHQLGMSSDPIGLMIPPHEGNVTKWQIFNPPHIPIISATIEFCDPILDYAILSIPSPPNSMMPNPIVSENTEVVSVGCEVAVVGYPLSVIGSIIQTYEIGNVSALLARPIHGKTTAKEIVLNKQSYSGSSGSMIIDRRDNKIIGMLRGCIAPPAVISSGNLPLGTDTNITIGLLSSEFITQVNKLSKE